MILLVPICADRYFIYAISIKPHPEHLKIPFWISILLISTKENSRTRTAQTDKHRKFKQLEILLDIEQNSKMAACPGMEEKIQKLQKQLSDLKLSNKNMKTQLTRINVLKVSEGSRASRQSPALRGFPGLATCLPVNFYTKWPKPGSTTQWHNGKSLIRGLEKWLSG